MPHLTDIYDEIATLIGGMTTGGGYNFTWDSTSVNPKDFDMVEAIQSGDAFSDIFPVTLVHYGEEVVEKPSMNQLAANGQSYTNDIDFKIEVRVGASDVNTADQEINKAVSDLKKLFFNNDCLNGNSFIVLYTGHIREPFFADASGCAGRLLFNITVRYNQDITNPEVLV